MTGSSDPRGAIGALEHRKTAAVIGLCVVIVADVYRIYADLSRSQAVDDAIAGHASLEDLAAADDRVRAAVIVGLIATVIAGVTFLVWFHRAYSTLGNLGATGLRWSSAWAVGYWFIPIFNLFRPKQLTNDLWRATDPAAPPENDRASWGDGKVSAIVHWWWALLIISVIGERLATAPADADASRIASADRADSGATILSIIAAVLAIEIVRRVTKRHRARAQALSDAGAMRALAAQHAH